MKKKNKQVRYITNDNQIEKMFPDGDDFVEKHSVSSLFFPSAYRKEFGAKSITLKTKWGEKKFKPLLSSFIYNFLEEQGPGTTDMGIPLFGRVDDKVIVVSFDGGCGNLVQIWQKKKFDKQKAANKIVAYHNLKESEEVWS